MRDDNRQKCKITLRTHYLPEENTLLELRFGFYSLFILKFPVDETRYVYLCVPVA